MKNKNLKHIKQINDVPTIFQYFDEDFRNLGLISIGAIKMRDDRISNIGLKNKKPKFPNIATFTFHSDHKRYHPQNNREDIALNSSRAHLVT
jgi:hypothetical protein